MIFEYNDNQYKLIQKYVDEFLDDELGVNIFDANKSNDNNFFGIPSEDRNLKNLMRVSVTDNDNISNLIFKLYNRLYMYMDLIRSHLTQGVIC